MPVSKAQQKAVSKYMKENYDEIKIRMGKGKKETIQAAAVGESVNAYINAAITQRMERDAAGSPSEAVRPMQEIERDLTSNDARKARKGKE